MGKKNKNKYYAWILPNGDSGICDNWDDCQEACLGWHGEKHQGFKTYAEAWNFAYPGVPMPDNTGETQSLQVKSESLNVNNDDSVDEAVEATSSYVFSEADSEEISEQVNEYCRKYKFTRLSDAQKRAVQSVEGKTLLFAVPGSGKTTVIIARTGYMVYSLGISPGRIMSLTFTKAAAAEMRERYCKHFHVDMAPDFRTIHSLCYSVILPRLQRDGFSCPQHIIGEEIDDDSEEEDKQKYQPSRIFRIVFEKIKLNTSDFETAMEASQTLITGIKNTMMSREKYDKHLLKICGQDVSASAIYDAYQEILTDLDCIDFDDLLSYSLYGLQEYSHALEELRKRYLYWSVDEAQDNSLLQSLLLNLLCGEDGNLFMVGDDDQSIYGFRGANPHLLADFAQRPNVKTLLMGVNYRSDFEIINTAKSFIELNENRAQKELEPFSKSPGEIVIPGIFKTEASQYEYIISAAREAINNHKTLAILYRRNISSLPLIVYMHKKGIDYEANKGIREILQSKHIKAIWRIMYFAVHPTNWKAFSSCHDYLGIYLYKDEKSALEKEMKRLNGVEILPVLLEKYQENNAEGENDDRIEHIRKVSDILEKIKYKTPSEAVIEILEQLYIVTLENIGDRLRIYSMLSACDQFNSIEEFVKCLKAIIKKESKKDKESEDRGDCDDNADIVITAEKPLVTLSTMHSSKGREFDRVIIIDTFEEIMPGKPRDDALIYDPEEERRLFYVSVTRAAHRLDILTVDKYHGNSETVSSFVTEFAYFSENNGENPNVLGTADQNAPKSTTVVFKPAKYYAVRAGRIPGVYKTWSECQEQVIHFSGADYKSFATLEEAKDYAALSAEPQPELKTDSIDKHLISSGGVVFNYPVDLPAQITKAIYDYFGVNTLKEIAPDKLERLIEMSRPFGDNLSTDYSARTEAYMLAYLPVNFFKIWKPLRELLERNALPADCRILELGAGPGTATLGLLYFYILLASNNPNVSFSLDITAVERENGFKGLFLYLTETLCRILPKNFRANITFINTDAFSFAPAENQNFDILLESNMMNADENISEEAMANFLKVVSRAVCPSGYTLMVEPGRRENIKQLKRISDISEQAHIANAIRNATICATDISGITLCDDALNAGIRYSGKKEHWFSYMVLQNEVTDI